MPAAKPGTEPIPFVRDLLVRYSLTQRFGPIAGPWLHEALGVLPVTEIRGRSVKSASATIGLGQQALQW